MASVNPAMIRRIVDLPEPDWPSNASISPFPHLEAYIVENGHRRFNAGVRVDLRYVAQLNERSPVRRRFRTDSGGRFSATKDSTGIGLS